MVKYISTEWKNKLSTDFDHEIRAYLNPRGKEYGPISSAGSFVSTESTNYTIGAIPEIPNDPAGVTYLQDAWATVDGWFVQGFVSGTVAVSGGSLIFTKGSANEYARKALAYSSGATIRVKVKVVSGAPSSLNLSININSSTNVIKPINGIGEWTTVDVASTGVGDRLGLWVGSLSGAETYVLEVRIIYIGTGAYLPNSLIDNSGNGNHGTICGATPVDGISGKALAFDGVNDYVSMGDILDIPGAMTYSAWIKIPSATAVFQWIINKENGSGNRGPYIGVNATSGRPVFVVSVDGVTGTTVTEPSINYCDNAWHLLTGVFTPSVSLELYVDGIRRAINTTSIPASQFNVASNLVIGARANLSAFVLGTIGEPRIYNRALSAEEVKRIHNGERITQGLIAEYTCTDKYYNASGSYSGYQLNNNYAIPFSTPLSIDLTIKPNFAYATAEYTLASWTYGTHYVKLGYNHTSKRFFVAMYTSSETRVYFGPTFTGDTGLQLYGRIGIVFNGTTVDAYYGQSKTSAAFDTSGLTNLHILNIGGGINCYVNNIRLFNIAATESQVYNHFKELSNAEIYFDFNKKMAGRERCSVTANRDLFNYSIDNPSTYSAASASVSLYNANGQYNDDTFKPLTALFPADTLYPSDTLYPLDADYSFTPELGYCNGTSDQIYLQRRVGLELEAWRDYGDIECFEPLFIGSIQPGSFSRSVQAGGLSAISVSANDGIAEIAKRIIRKNRNYEDYYLTSESTPATSLFHVIGKLATEREIYNYLCNSGFENTTIANSWTVEGGTITRSTTQKLFGTYACKMNATAIAQTVTFELSKGERFNYSAWVYSATPVIVSIKIAEYISTALVSSSNTSAYHGGNGWELLDVTHSVINSSSNRLKCYIEPATTGDVYIDGSMLVYGDYKPFYVDNTNDGTAGSSSSSQAVRGAYDWIGIDADTVTYQHPWAVVKEGKKVWDYLKQIADATIARYLYVDRSGVLRFKSNLNTAIGSSLGTIGKVSGIGSGMQSAVANKVKAAGVYINKKAHVENVWQVEASGIEDDNDDGATFVKAIAAGATFPLATESPDGIEAKYGDVYEGV